MFLEQFQFWFSARFTSSHTVHVAPLREQKKGSVSQLLKKLCSGSSYHAIVAVATYRYSENFAAQKQWICSHFACISVKMHIIEISKLLRHCYSEHVWMFLSVYTFAPASSINPVKMNKIVVHQPELLEAIWCVLNRCRRSDFQSKHTSRIFRFSEWHLNYFPCLKWVRLPTLPC